MMRFAKDEKKRTDGSVALLESDRLEITRTEDGLLVCVLLVDAHKNSQNDIAWDTACVVTAVARAVSKEYDVPLSLFHAKVASRREILNMEGEAKEATDFG